jgi:hypothetical protein
MEANYAARVRDAINSKDKSPEAFARFMAAIAADPENLTSRIGDLIHDILQEVSSPIPPARTSMREFVGLLHPGDVALGHIPSFLQNSNNILAVMNTFGRTPPIQLFPAKELSGLQTYLRGQGVKNILLDSQFGNIFTKGFGEGFTYIDATVSQIDGASKIGAKVLGEIGIRYQQRYEEFVLPHFYSGVMHRIRTGSVASVAAAGNSVDIAYDGPAGKANATITCKSGISVNAICNAVGLDAPRGTGEEGTPIHITANAGAYGKNHIVFVKTLTDWSQLAYCYYLNNVVGESTVFITNDEFCLCLAAILGLPFVLRTPSTKATNIELYSFSNSPIEAEEAARIQANIRQGVTAEQRDALLRHIADALPPENSENILTECLKRELEALANSVQGFLDGIRDDIDLRQVRFLANTTLFEYVRTTIDDRLYKLYMKFSKFRIHISHCYSNINTDFDRKIELFKNIVASLLSDKTVYPDAIKDAIYAKIVVLFTFRSVVATSIGSQRYSGPQLAMGALGITNLGRRDLFVPTILQALSRLQEIAGEEAVVSSGKKRGREQEGGNEEEEEYVILHTITADEQREIADIQAIHASNAVRNENKLSVHVDAIDKYFNETIATIHSLADYGACVVRLLELMDADAYETNLGDEWEIAVENCRRLLDGFMNGAVPATVFKSQLDYYTNAGVTGPIFYSVQRNEHLRKLYMIALNTDTTAVPTGYYGGRGDTRLMKMYGITDSHYRQIVPQGVTTVRGPGIGPGARVVGFGPRPESGPVPEYVMATTGQRARGGARTRKYKKKYTRKAKRNIKRTRRAKRRNH